VKARWDEIKGVNVSGNGVMHDGIRKVFSGKNCMAVLNEIKPLPYQLTEIPTHSHPHEQLCYIMHGQCKFKLGDETFDVSSGEIIYIPPDVQHGLILTSDEACLNLDIFSPIREDYLPKD